MGGWEDGRWEGERGELTGRLLIGQHDAHLLDNPGKRHGGERELRKLVELSKNSSYAKFPR